MDRPLELPPDADACHALLREAFARLLSANSQLSDATGALEQTASSVDALQQENRQLREELQLFKKLLFGPRRERLVESPDQQHLFEVGSREAAAGAMTDADSTDEPETSDDGTAARRRHRDYGRGPLPAHLPRVEQRRDLSPAEKLCACCGEEMTCIGEDVVETLELNPAKLWVNREVRPKYACSKHKEGVASASPAPKLLPGGRYGFGVVAEVVNNKFHLHLPLYRQQDLLASAGIELGRSTLCDLVRTAAERLQPLAARLRELTLQSSVLWTDDTPVPLQEPGGVKQARFWTVLGDEQHPYDIYDFTLTRQRDGPQRFLQGYRGYLHADAYGGYDGIYLNSRGGIVEVACWAHARRKFYEARDNDPRRAHQVLAWIQQLYDIEDRAARFSTEARRELRQRESVPVLDKIEAWLAENRPTVLPKSAIGQAVTYAHNQWAALRQYVEDGRLTIDNNASERRLRAQAIGRNNWLFLGSPEAGQRAAVLYTIVSSAKRQDLDTWAYLRDVLERLTVGDVELDSLLPDRWKVKHPEFLRSYRQHEREAKAAAKRARRQQRRQLNRTRRPPK